MIDLASIQEFVKVLGDLGAVGTCAFAIFFVYCTYFKKDKEESKSEGLETKVFKTDTSTNVCIDTELKRLLKTLLGEVEKIGGNDLSHLKLAVDTLGTSVGRLENKVDMIEEKLDAHDKQALTILNNQSSLAKSVDDIKRLIERPLYKV